MLLDLNPTADPGLTRLSAEKLSYANAFGLTLDMTKAQIRERKRHLTEHFICGVRSARLRDHLFEVKPDSLIDAHLVPSHFIDEEFESETINYRKKGIRGRDRMHESKIT